MKIFLKSLSLFFLIFILSCTTKENGAQLRLDAARVFYSQKQYGLAKTEIDSIKILYPKSFDQIRAGLALLDSVRRGENVLNIGRCDSLIIQYTAKADSLKKLFVYQIDKEYQNNGSYIPKEAPSSIQNTTLRSGVTDNSNVYIESVFLGSQKHNKIRISDKNGASIESLPVTGDGLNYRFSNLGKQYEILYFSGSDENGVARFIADNKDKTLNLTLSGQGNYTYTLPITVKNAITKSYQLSVVMLQLDSLKVAKELSEFRNYHLDNKYTNASQEAD